MTKELSLAFFEFAENVSRVYAEVFKGMQSEGRTVLEAQQLAHQVALLFAGDRLAPRSDPKDNQDALLRAVLMGVKTPPQ